LDGLLPLSLESPSHNFKELQHATPLGPLTLELAGEKISINVGDEAALFKRPFNDIETLLSLHRFSWVSSLTDPAWVGVLWRAWLQGFSTPSDSMVWHPYTAAERAVNILAFAGRYGLPNPSHETLSVLAAHAPAIAARLV